MLRCTAGKSTMTEQNSSSRRPHPKDRFLKTLSLCWMLLLSAAPGMGVAAVTTTFSGSPQVITTAEKVTGSATGAPLQAARKGADFHIQIKGLPDEGPVELELGFAELENRAPGERVFNLDVNGKRALIGFDIVKEAGAKNRSIVKKFTITPAQGELDFHFTAVKGEALVSYIQIRGKGVNTLIAAPSPTSSTSDASDDDLIPADAQASYNAEKGAIHLDGASETWNSGVPIGGIGTGKFELLPNGQFGNFTISNSWDLPVLRPRGTFLAIAAKAVSGKGGARLLQVNPSDHRGKKIYPDHAGMSEGDFFGDFPFGKVELSDEKFPLRATIEGWSPVVPHNTADSSLPAAVVNVVVRNPQKYPLSVGVAFSWEDISGRGGSLLAGDQHGFSAASTHRDAATSSVTGIQISSSHSTQDRAATFTGDYFIGTPIKGAVVTRSLAWNPRNSTIPWWNSFSRKLRLDKIPASPGSSTGGAGSSGPMASSLCVSFNLAPRETRRIPFIVAWHTPKVVTLDSAGGDPSVEEMDYSERFDNALEVASYLSKKRRDLRALTEEWTEMVDRATVPQWLKSHVRNSLFPVHTNTVLLKDKRFAVLESPADMRGMLGGIDVGEGAADFLLTMFPELQKTELNLYARAQAADGRIPRYVGNIHGALSGFDQKLLGENWYDPTAAWLLELARYWRETGDYAGVEALKPTVTKARDYLSQQVKSPAEGAENNVLTQLGGFAHSSVMSRLRAITALDAAAALLGEPLDDALRKENAGKRAAEQTTATFAAMLAADYSARAAALPRHFTDAELTPLLRDLRNELFAASRPVPLMESSDGAASVSMPTLLQPYLGAVALQAGLPDFGLEPYLRMFQIAYGAQKAPWKQALVYDTPAAAKPVLRYHRSAMGAWSIWRALSGAVYDKPNQQLFLNPVSVTTGTLELEIPVFTPDFWAWLKYDAADSTGTLSITKVLSETTPTLSAVASSLGPDGSPRDLVRFTEPVLLEEGTIMTMTGWPGAAGSVTWERPQVQLPDDDETTASLSLDMDDDSTTPPASQSSPETAEGEEMTTSSASSETGETP